MVELVLLADTFNRNFEPTEAEILAEENQDKKKARERKREKYYENIELDNDRFQEFAFATHPDAYNPKAMSELPIKDLVLILRSPDFKEWIGPGAYGTWLQAAIVAGEIEYGKLLKENYHHYSQKENSILRDSWIILKEEWQRVLIPPEIRRVKTVIDTVSVYLMEGFIKKNRITHE